MIDVTHLSKTYPGAPAPALRDITLHIPSGSIFGIIGVSGAGKSTLVRCLNILEKPSEGSIVVDGLEVTMLRGNALRSYRHRIAMIFQNFGLLAQKTVLANVCFPFKAAYGRVSPEQTQRASELLDLVGLADKLSCYPAQLSGGQKQRVAIARALALEPEYLLCDEATSALDPASTATILALLQKINQTTGVTVVVITHDMDVIKQICTDVAVIDAGEIVEVGKAAEVLAAPQSLTAQRLLGKATWLEEEAHA